MSDAMKVGVKDLGGVGKGGGVIFRFLKSYMYVIYWIRILQRKLKLYWLSYENWIMNELYIVYF